MKKTKTLLFPAILAVLAFGTLTFTSCKKNTPITSITYDNDTYTPVYVTANGKNVTIPVGGSYTFDGSAGSTLNVTATTSGSTSSGTQVGELIEWNSGLSAQFPPDGTTEIGIDVSSDYFFLQVQNNNSSNNAVGIYVNAQLPSPEYDDVTIPNDGNLYGIGYYLAYSNTEIEIGLSSNPSSYESKYPSLPFTTNQQYTFYF